MGINHCPGCLEKQRQIDALQEELVRLKRKLWYQERKATEGFFGASTPSSKRPVKPNTATKKQSKPRGARVGHKGAGRKRCDMTEADRIVEVAGVVPQRCPQCGAILEDKGFVRRDVLESQPLKAESVLYLLAKKHCPHCRKTFQAETPGVLPKSLYGNQLIANAATMHYLHGIPQGRVCEQIGIGSGALVEIFHRLAKVLGSVPEHLVEQYRNAAVKHADETGWRTNGKNGYAWLFATDRISIFQFRTTRSAGVPKAIFGEKKLPGVLIVDRYAAYNKMPCAIQYCYEHLQREVEDLGKEFSDVQEVKTFVSTLVPLLSLAMNLRTQAISDKSFYRRAKKLKAQIVEIVNNSARHPGIQRIQDIFREHEDRMYHWVADRKVPAENNLAERDLRPTVIARKVSFGSSSDAGAHTRGVLMTVMQTLKKQRVEASAHLKHVLDELARDMNQNPFPLLFPENPPDGRFPHG
jgi:transposase